MQFIEILKANSGLPWHCVGGVVITLIVYFMSCKYFVKEDSKRLAVYVLFLVAILWEIVEYLLGIQAYNNNFKLFFIDSFQDVICALVCSAITAVVLKWLGK